MSNDINIGAISEALNNKMDLDGNNVVASAGASFRNTSNWSNNMTNCITYIPQDINLELNDGTLTLKAGSKVYVPNGTGVFDEVIIENDVIDTGATRDQNCPGTLLLVKNNIFKYLTPEIKSIPYFYSGPTAPTTFFTGYAFWYDTTNNIVKFTENSGSTWDTGYSLPIGIVQCVPGAWSSIDQVFNGFGFIGSTVFSLPGIKGLIPDGRNADGTLKNINFTVNNVTTNTLSATGWHGMWSFYFNEVNSATMIHPTELEYISNSKPTGIYTPTAFWYSPSENKLYFTQDTGSTWTQVAYVHIDFTETSKQITSIDIEYPFRAVDYSEADFVVAFQKPTAENSYTWYRKYKSGWVEQGGWKNSTGGTITFPIAMSLTNQYTAIAVHNGNTAKGEGVIHCYNKTSTTMSVALSTSTSGMAYFSWRVEGMAA